MAPSVSRLADSLAGVDDRARSYILGSLSTSAESVPELIRIAICNDDSGIRAGAVVAMLRIETPEGLLPTLVELCRDGEGENRGRAAWALGKMGADALSALPTLLNMAETDEAVDARFGSLWAIARLGPRAASASGAIRKIVPSDEDGSVRAIAALALGILAVTSDEIEETLCSVALNGEALEREESVRALGRLKSSRESGATLVSAASDDAPLIREAAVEALGRLNNRSGRVIEALHGRLVDPFSFVQAKSVEALCLLGEDGSAERGAVDGSASVRVAPTEGKGPIPWIEQLESPDAFERAVAGWELSILGPASSESLSRLCSQAVDDENSDARWTACLCIGRIRSADEMSVETLARIASQDSDPDVRSAAVEGLGGLGVDAPEVIGFIVHALRDEDSLVREEATGALERSAVNATQSLVPLMQLVDDPHPSVRRRAKAAANHINRVVVAFKDRGQATSKPPDARLRI